MYFSFFGPFLGSDGLGTRLDPMKTEDSALSEPLGSSGDCNRTHFRPIFGWGDKHDRMAMLVGPLLMGRPHSVARLSQTGEWHFARIDCIAVAILGPYSEPSRPHENRGFRAQRTPWELGRLKSDPCSTNFWFGGNTIPSPSPMGVRPRHFSFGSSN